jgi:hypothetical protein
MRREGGWGGEGFACSYPCAHQETWSIQRFITNNTLGSCSTERATVSLYSIILRGAVHTVGAESQVTMVNERKPVGE